VKQLSESINARLVWTWHRSHQDALIFLNFPPAVYRRAGCADNPPAMEQQFSIRVVGVSKRFGALAAVDDVSADIRRGEFFSLLGPSGCGKTTLLRMIAGLESQDTGDIIIDGEGMRDVPAHQRPVNLVFQHYALFPHLTVEKNVAFGLRYKVALPRGQWRERITAALDMVRLSGLEKRYPDELSGGQKQRVALARALVLEPRVLLLDEPLAALDQKLRKEMQVELKHLQRRLGITFVFVTHDQEEALVLSDRIAVMNHGKVEQLGSAAEVFEKPRTAFIADFMGAGNFLSAQVTKVDGAITTVTSPAGFETVLLTQGAPVRQGDEIRFIVRPEKLELERAVPPAKSALASMEVTIEERVYQGITTLWTVRNRAGERLVVCQQNDLEAAGDEFVVMGKAWVCWDPRYAVVMDDINLESKREDMKHET
jgi:spermidine/putrescine transport system ATP-binding protein